MKGLKKYMAGILVAGMVLGSAAVPAPVYATEAEDAQEDNGDDVEITLDDKPYLALGADLTADQQHTVLSYMGIEAADFDKYQRVWKKNGERDPFLCGDAQSGKLCTMEDHESGKPSFGC